MNESVDDTFWLVWNPRGHAPTIRHDTRHSAITEAERLARINPDAQFFVLQAIELREVTAMRRVTLAELPF